MITVLTVDWGDIDKGTYDCIDVEFEIHYSVENDTFSHEFGTEYYSDYILVEDLTWDKSKYTEEQNFYIEEEINKNFQKYSSVAEKIVAEKIVADYEAY